jgi:dATP pyrophosphohydrolase
LTPTGAARKVAPEKDAAMDEDDSWGEMPVRCRAVAVAVLDTLGERNAQVLLVQRGLGSYRGEWTLITGRIERNETAWQAALREVREEAGLSLAALYSAGFCDQFYSPALEAVEVVPVFVGVAMLNDENTAFQWSGLRDAADLMPFHGHRVALGIVEREFVHKYPAHWRRVAEA